MKKYKIDQYLYSLNVSDYKKASKLIPEILGIAYNTFHNYRRIGVGEPKDIPYEKVITLEKLFGFEPGELTNQDVEVKPLKELFKDIPDLVME